MIGKVSDRSVREEEKEPLDPRFDDSKLGMFVCGKAGESDENSVERRPVESSQEKHSSNGRTLCMPGTWQDAIEEEAEEEHENPKFRDLEKRKINQKPMNNINKPLKMKLNFSIWERKDSFASKRAVKRIFMNRTGLQCNTETQSSKQMGNTTVDTSEQNTADKSRQFAHKRKMSLMTELSNSGGKCVVSKTCG